MSVDQGELRPDFEAVQAHYDRPQGLYFAFLDQRRRIRHDGPLFRVPTYSCAYFPTGGETLEEAQQAKIDLSLRKLSLNPGQRLLDIGFGWGSVAFWALDKFGLDVMGLTLSQNQYTYAVEAAGQENGVRFLLEGWETHEGEYDGIISIGAFEHFGRDNYPAFFQKANELLVPEGRMLLHTITFGKNPTQRLTFARYASFIDKEIFPRGQLPYPEDVIKLARQAGFEIATDNLSGVSNLRPHYAKTADYWTQNLEANRENAVSTSDEQTYQIYMKYLTESAKWFRSGEIAVMQFLLQKV